MSVLLESIQIIVNDTSSWRQLKLSDEKLSNDLLKMFEESLEKLQQPIARVAFLGGFSSGKSSLINAILNTSILPTGNKPLTANLVECMYGETNCVEVFQDSEWYQIHEDISDSLLNRLKDQYPGKWFRITTPDFQIPSNLQLMDAPGFNSEDPEHADLAIQAVQMANIVVVVTDYRGMSKDLREFIADLNISKDKILCLVLNKMDVIDERDDVEELLELSHSYLKQLGWEEAPSIVCSAHGTLNEDTGVEGWKAVQEWFQEMARSQVEKLVHLHIQNRLQFSVNSNLAVTQDVLNNLESSIQKIQEKLSEKESIEQIYDRISESVVDEFVELNNGYIEDLGAFDSSNIDAFIAWLNNDSTDLLNDRAVKRNMKHFLGRFASHSQMILRSIADALHSTGNNGLSEFDTVIAKQWEDLDIPQQIVLESDVRAILQANVGVGHFSADDFSGEDILGGAAIGAIVGSIVPGVGTLIGGLIGGFFSLLFGESKESKIYDALLEMFDDKRDEIIDAFNAERTRIIEEHFELLEERFEQRASRYETQLLQVNQELQEEYESLLLSKDASKNAVAIFKKWASDLP